MLPFVLKKIRDCKNYLKNINSKFIFKSRRGCPNSINWVLYLGGGFHFLFRDALFSSHHFVICSRRRPCNSWTQMDSTLQIAPGNARRPLRGRPSLMALQPFPPIIPTTIAPEVRFFSKIFLFQIPWRIILGNCSPEIASLLQFR